MPIPLIIGAIAAVTALGGAKAAKNGYNKVSKAKEISQKAERRYKRNMRRFETAKDGTETAMDTLGEKQLEVLQGLKRFSDCFARIQNKPEFKEIQSDKIDLPAWSAQEIEACSINAAQVLGSMATGSFAGLAASGAATSLVAAFGTASTGTAIGTLSGAAATNATLAAIGGGSLAAGGGGVALGTTLLGAGTLGIGLLAGGLVFSYIGDNQIDKAREAEKKVIKHEAQVDRAVAFLDDLHAAADAFYEALARVQRIYGKFMAEMEAIVDRSTDWARYEEYEKDIVTACVNLVAVQYGMCKVRLVKKDAHGKQLQEVNHRDMEKAIENADVVLEKDLGIR